MRYHVNEAWFGAIAACYRYGDRVKPRNLLCREIIAAQYIVDMNTSFLTIPERKMGARFPYAEAYWILSGSNKLEDIIKYAPDLKKYSNDGIWLDGAYGPPIMDQMPYVVKKLQTDHDSRQAIISIWRARPYPSLDIPCTLTMQFLLRGTEIHTIVNMRSSDLWLGFPYDVFTFSCITKYISLFMYEPHTLGKLYLNTGSSHLYEVNWS